MNSSALDKVRIKLKPTVTRVTTADGKVHHEAGGVVTEHDDEVRGPGYVVDTAPDLTLHCCGFSLVILSSLLLGSTG